MFELEFLEVIIEGDLATYFNSQSPPWTAQYPMKHIYPGVDSMQCAVAARMHMHLRANKHIVLRAFVLQVLYTAVSMLLHEPAAFDGPRDDISYFSFSCTRARSSLSFSTPRRRTHGKQATPSAPSQDSTATPRTRFGCQPRMQSVGVTTDPAKRCVCGQRHHQRLPRLS